MARFFVFLICTAVVFVEGRPRHHKHKKAHETTYLNDDTPPQAYHQPMGDKATGPPQNINVYNMGVRKMGKDNKVTAQMGAHNVAVTMQGPGMISLAATQQQVAPGDQKPDHTISVVKDTSSEQSHHMMNIHSGHELPVVIPLSEPPSPQAASEEGKSHGKQPAPSTQDVPRIGTKPRPRIALQEGQPQGSSVHVRLHKMNKEKVGKVLTILENRVPVVKHQPKHEEQVDNGHKIKIANAGKPQKVFGRVDSNNVGLIVHGPGSAYVTSNVKGGTSQTVIFDPSPYDPCPGDKCQKGSGGNGIKK